MTEKLPLPSTASSINLDTELAEQSQHFEDQKELIQEDSTSSSSGMGKRHFGNNFVFLFRNNEPSITIGPHCENFKIVFFFV